MELKMSKTWKRVISFVLAFAMAFSFTPNVAARAAAADEVVVEKHSVEIIYTADQTQQLTAPIELESDDGAYNGGTFKPSVTGYATFTGPYALDAPTYEYWTVEAVQGGGYKYVASLGNEAPVLPGTYAVIATVTGNQVVAQQGQTMGRLAVNETLVDVFKITNVVTETTTVDHIYYAHNNYSGLTLTGVDAEYDVDKLGTAANAVNPAPAVDTSAFANDFAVDAPEYSYWKVEDVANGEAKLVEKVDELTTVGHYVALAYIHVPAVAVGERNEQDVLLSKFFDVKKHVELDLDPTYGVDVDYFDDDVNGDFIDDAEVIANAVGESFVPATEGDYIARLYVDNKVAAYDDSTFGTFELADPANIVIKHDDGDEDTPDEEVTDLYVVTTANGATGKYINDDLDTTGLVVVMKNKDSKNTSDNLADPKILDEHNRDLEAASKVVAEFTYTGSKITPVIDKVYYNGDLLDATEYTAVITGQNAVNMYPFTVTLKDDETQTVTGYWAITKGEENVNREWSKWFTGDDDEYNIGDRKVSFGDSPVYAGKDATAVEPTVTNLGTRTAKYYYYKYEDVKKEGVDATVNTVLNKSGAAAYNYVEKYADVKDNADIKAVPVVVDAGIYVAYAAIDESGSFAAEEDALIYEIAPKNIYVVPGNNQGKNFGDAENTKDSLITFEAYEYYNIDGKRTWKNYADAAAVEVDTDGNVTVNGETHKATEVRENVPLTLDIVNTPDKPFLVKGKKVNPELTAAAYNTQYKNRAVWENLKDEYYAGTTDENYTAILTNAEAAGAYAIVVNAAGDSNFNVVSDAVTGTYTQGLTVNDTDKNFLYTIKQRPLSGADIQLYTVDPAVDPTAKPVSPVVFTNDGQYHEVFYKATDAYQKWNVVKKAYDNSKEVELIEDADYETTGNVREFRGDDYKIKFTALGNYTGEVEKEWKITQTTNGAIYGVYATTSVDVSDAVEAAPSGRPDLEFDRDEDAKGDVIDYFDDQVATVTYDGNYHSVDLEVLQVAPKNADPVDYDQATDGNVFCYYKANEDYRLVARDPAERYEVTGLVDVDKDTDWQTTAPAFKEVGTYTVDYKIVSEKDRFAVQTGTFTITIEEKPVILTAPTIVEDVVVYDTPERVNQVIEEQGGYTIKTDKNKNLDGPVANGKGSLYVTYSWPEDALLTATTTKNPYTLKVAKNLYDAEAFTESWIETYDNGVLEAYLLEKEVASYDDLTPEQKAEVTALYFANLSDDDKKAPAADLDAALKLEEAKCKHNENFQIASTVDGKLRVEVATAENYDLQISVTANWKDSTAVDFDPAVDPYEWKYGTYDITTDNVVVNRHLNGDVYEDLPEDFASRLTYTVYKWNGEQYKAMPDYVGIDNSELDQVMFALTPGAYYVKAQIGTLAMKNDQLTAESNEFEVTEGILEIVEGEENLVGGKTPLGKAPTKLEKIIVKEVDSETGLQAGDNTYKLQYAVYEEGEEPIWRDSLADLAEDDLFIWDTKGTKDILVRVFPLVNGEEPEEGEEFFVVKEGQENGVKVSVTVTAAEHGKNDIVDTYTVKHIAENAGEEVKVGVGDYVIEKTYGKYTANKKTIDNVYMIENYNYVGEETDNKVTINYSDEGVAGEPNTAAYVATELLSHNGFAVGKQNTNFHWVTTDGENHFVAYEDAEKVAYEYVNKGYNDQSGIAPAAGFIANAFDLTDPLFTLDGIAAQELIAGIKLTATLESDPNGIIATRTINGEPQPIVGVKDEGKNVYYQLAKNFTASGQAVIKVTVERENFNEIEFNIIVSVDAGVPEIGIYNASISRDVSTTVNTEATVTDKYVNVAPVFDITTSDVDGGVYYTWIKENPGEGIIDLLDITFDIAKLGKFDERLGWYELKGNTIKTPDEDGPYILYVRGEDDSNNVVYASSATGFTLDTVNPVIKNANSAETYGETLKNILVAEKASASLTVIDDNATVVKAGLGDKTPEEISVNATTLNYELAANEETYTVVATDAAGNQTTAFIDVNYPVDNKVNAIAVTFVGEEIDLATVLDETDKETPLYVKNEHSGAISFANGTEKKEADETTYVYKLDGLTRGEGTVENGKLKVTKAGSFAIEVISEKAGIWGKTTKQATLTVKKGTREVGIELVEDPAADKATAKDVFTKTEAANMKDFAKISYSVTSVLPKDEYVKFVYYDKKAPTVKLDKAPTAVGEYEVAVAIEDDGLFNATTSETATTEGFGKRASYTIVDTNKVVVTNDAKKGTVVINDGTKDLTAEEALAVPNRTKLTITATALDGYKFMGWTDVSGIELSDADAKNNVVTIEAVTGDVKLTAVYAAILKITTEPADTTVKLDETATFTVVATGDADDLTYQWYMKGVNETNFEPIPGANAASYTTPKATAANDGQQFRVVVSSKASEESVTSRAATLTVNSATLEGAKITLEADSVPYNGQVQAPKIVKVVAADGTEVGSDEYEVSTDTYVEVKEYTVTITGKGDYTGSASTKYTITKAKVTVEAGTAKLTNRVYDGTVDMAVEGELDVKGIPAGSDIKVAALPQTVKVDDKNAGEKTYVFKIKLEGEDAANVDLGTESIELKGTIAKKGVTLNDMTFKPKYYDGSKYMELTTQKGTIKSGLVKGDDVQFTTKQAKYVITGTKSAGQKKRKLTKGLWNITGKDAANYKLAAGPIATGTIKKVVVKKVTLKATSVKYNGKAQKPVIKAITGTNGVKVLQKNCKIEYLRNGKSTADFKSKGKITVKVTGVGTEKTGSNWKGTVSVTYTIK